MRKFFSRLFGTKTTTFRHPKMARPACLAIEALEMRDCPASIVTVNLLAGGILNIEGTPSADSILIRQNGSFLSVSKGLADGSLSLIGRTYHESEITRVVANGLGGRDIIRNDTMKNSTIRGGEDNDILFGGHARDDMYGEGGNDLMFGAPGGHDGVETSSNGSDTMWGGVGNDTLYGGYFNDSLIGQDGRDELHGQWANDLVVGSNWNHAANTPDPIETGESDDILFGDNGNDTIYGGSGADRISGGWDSDVMHGDYGNDLMWGNFENNPIGRPGNVNNDTMYGGRGNDTMYGGSGDDELSGDWDSDELHGLDGRDKLWGASVNDANGRPGFVNDDTLRGGNSNDTLWGGNGNDLLYGDGGIDILNGMGGNDGLFGGWGDGKDSLHGGAGADRFLQTRFNLGLFRIDEDQIWDLSSADARVSFSNGQKNWTDAEVKSVDVALAWLHKATKNVKLLKLKSGGEVTFYRYTSLPFSGGFFPAADNDSSGTIRVADTGVMSPASIVHEIAHNWEDENARWTSFQGLSGWRPLATNRPVPTGFTRARDTAGAAQPWIYLSNAQFVRAYGRTNPFEDFATCLEEYYRGSLSTTLWGAKWSFMNRFLREMSV